MRGVTIVLLTLVTMVAHAQPARWSVDDWRADLDHLHEHIRTVHANPYHTISKAELDAAFESLLARVHTMDDASIAIEVQRILASLGDGHSHFQFWGQDLVQFYPIRLHAFSDGIHITEAKDGGPTGRLLAIDGMPIEEAAGRVIPHISRDNDMAIPALLPGRLRMAEFLHALGIANSAAEATFTVERKNGTHEDAVMRAVPYADIQAWESNRPRDASLPLYRRDPSTNYWYEPLPDAGAMYMQFNTVRPMEGQHLGQFSDEVLGAMDELGMECLIIDIRHNGGGDGNILGPLVRRLSRHERINRPGHLYLITGPRTFSAALILTLRLERETEVIIAGEAGSGKPNSYSESGPYELPRTGLRGSVSALFREDGDPGDDRMLVPPQIPAAPTWEDYREGRDPVLEAVLAHWHELRRE